ncbi:MAG: glycosyltransferase [Sphingobacteriales bacterium]|nr:MAG: glycosyltransferase [Sphingobacteriales bacterium]
MIRICTSLVNAGYDVTLIGFERKTSKPLAERSFKQIRIPIIAEQGKLLYADYWRKLFFKLISGGYDVMCAIDLDTIMPVYFASALKGTKRVYDAHELFTELKEVVTRPPVYKMWSWIERFAVPKFPVGYTIGPCYADEFRKKYGVNYKVVRNATVLKPFSKPESTAPYILYQGWVNEGRCFEELIPAMQYVDMPLVICGEGNFYKQAKELAAQYNVTHKIDFKGYVPPDKLADYTKTAYIGITLFDAASKSNVLSMANRFFDYMHHGVPQLCMNFPEYQNVNKEYEVACLIDYPASPEDIGAALNKMITDIAYHSRMRENCLLAREKYCWQEEEKTLLSVYKELLG